MIWRSWLNFLKKFFRKFQNSFLTSTITFTSRKTFLLIDVTVISDLERRMTFGLILTWYLALIALFIQSITDDVTMKLRYRYMYGIHYLLLLGHIRALNAIENKFNCWFAALILAHRRYREPFRLCLRIASTSSRMQVKG